MRLLPTSSGVASASHSLNPFFGTCWIKRNFEIPIICDEVQHEWHCIEEGSIDWGCHRII